LFKRFAVVLATVLLIAGLGLPVSAQTPIGTVTGVLKNGTAGGSSVSNVEVRLETYVNSTLTANSTARTQNDGSFTFNNLATGTQNSYRVALTYQEADYSDDNITFASGETSRSANITVYDSTDNTDAVALDTAHTIIVLGKGELEFTIVYDFVNNTDRAYIGTGDPMANGKKKTLTFTIPADATQVQYGDGLLPSFVYPSHEGFIDTMAVLPGVKEVVYAYKVPYKGGTYTFNQKLNYSAAWFNLLVQGAGIKVTSKQLVDQGPLDMGTGNSYLYLTGQNFTAGQSIAATLSGSGTLSQTLIYVLASLAVVLILGGGFAYWRMRKGRALPPVRSAVEGADDEDSLLIDLARLDDDFAAGLISEDVYRVKRAAKKARLIKLMKRG
jgi:hypothetical protein